MENSRGSEAKPVADPLVAIVVSVSEEHFAENDDVCLQAGNYVCSLLELHLIRAGHSISEYVRGGIAEDWGVYFESQLGSETFEYAICFFTSDDFEPEAHMAVQYGYKSSLWRTILHKATSLPNEHPIHRTMRDFGAQFDFSVVMTRSEFNAAM